MAHLVWSLGDILWGGGIANDTMSTITTVMNDLADLLTKETVHNYIRVFCGIACSFLLIYFVCNIIALSTKEMLSLEKLIIEFVKLLLAFALLVYLDEIISTIVSLAAAVLVHVQGNKNTLMATGNDSSKKLTFNFGGTSWQDYPTWEELGGDSDSNPFVKYYNSGPLGIGGFFKGFTIIIPIILMNLFSLIIRVLAYMQIVSCAIKIIARTILSPIAVVQVFDDVQRSAGVKYIKSFLAECFTMVGFVVILYAAAKLEQSFAASACQEIMGDKTGLKINLEIMRNVAGNFGYLAKVAVANFASVGCMAAAGSLIKEVFGV